ncbi:hypothetical protein, partial [Neisseria gonorrhoeae]|uniref:hypothetical protein n=1 Tax=Neisseria gonorrhoeae TaxID=485 RepID=UPI001E307716
SSQTAADHYRAWAACKSTTSRARTGSGNRRSSPTIPIHDKQEFFMKMQYKMLGTMTFLGLMASLGTAH